MTTDKEQVFEYVSKRDDLVSSLVGVWVVISKIPEGFEVIRAMFDDDGRLVLTSSGEDNQEMTVRELVKLLAQSDRTR